MARSYKRDANGRFAGGGGGSGGKRGGTSKGKASGSGGRKQNKSRVTTTGTFLTRQKGKLAQQKRTKAFSSKATAGRSAKEAYKAASGAARKASKDRRAQLTYGSFSSKLQRTDPTAASRRRMNNESSRPLQFSGRKPGGTADRQFRDASATASYNRQQRSIAVAKEARKVLSLAAQSPSDWKSRPRFSTVRNPSKSNPAWSYSDLSAWGKPRRSRRRR